LPLTFNYDEAETIIINTCGFIEAAKEESINTLLQAVELKNRGRLKKLIVTGCLSERYKETLEKEIPEVDLYFGTEKYEEIINELGGHLKYELLGERLISNHSHFAYLKISEGCDHPCSFCAIPLIRGKFTSKSIESLIEEAQFLVSKGVKELILIAQDTTDYGKDIYGKKNLSKLLDSLSQLKGIEWIRLMYAYPSHFPNEVIEVIADNPKILKYVDIPLQHISDDVLKSMRRGITSKQTYKLLEILKKKIPDITLRTTFIVGYPNESEKDFNLLLDFIKEIQFDRIGTFTFSAEENTTSYILGDPVSQKEKLRRRDILMEIQSEISYQKNQSFIGKTLKVLVESKESEFYVGRSYRDAPEVDGEILFKSDSKIKFGSFYDVKIVDCDEYDLYGQI
jgi:ribosomal protein S12 methylthiotransferase